MLVETQTQGGMKDVNSLLSVNTLNGLKKKSQVYLVVGLWISAVFYILLKKFK